MSRHDKYPRLGSIRAGNKNTQAKCSACDELGFFIVEVQYGYMRGTDDEVYRACHPHRKMVSSYSQASLIDFLNMVEKKASTKGGKDK